MFGPYSCTYRKTGDHLADPASDGNQDGVVSLLEAFQYACQEIDRVYREQDLLKSESAVLEDDGDGIPSQQPWRFQETGNDGARASKWMFAGQLR